MQVATTMPPLAHALPIGPASFVFFLFLPMAQYHTFEWIDAQQNSDIFVSPVKRSLRSAFLKSEYLSFIFFFSTFYACNPFFVFVVRIQPLTNSLCALRTAVSDNVCISGRFF